SRVLILFGDKIRSQTKPFLYLFQLVAAKDPVHERLHCLPIPLYLRFRQVIYWSAFYRLFLSQLDAKRWQKWIVS
ncbi:hypothetical protein OE564_19745, partial [Aeromonas hydrophila]|uniref:hypothetical protein n=1 Tax=Aeromonas hydrophila TaxID=644 RepID=UPI0021F4F5B5